MTVFIILIYWTSIFDLAALELCKNTDIQSPFQATEPQSLGMAILQKLPKVFWWVPLVKDLYPENPQFTSQLICTWMKMVKQSILHISPIHQPHMGLCEMPQRCRRSRQEHSDQTAPSAHSSQSPILDEKQSHFVNSSIWYSAGGIVEGVWI